MGTKHPPSKYEFRINGAVQETSGNAVDLYWKARRAVNGSPGVYAEVESVEGFYSIFSCSDSTLRDWERA